ncbi:MAG: DUF4410 domain-containing protein [Gloeobacteraceae cyanobacterium ES-bin-144]|nr:DUF4410 domain-containing protein [Verrucomicrobiales bacterium]
MKNIKSIVGLSSISIFALFLASCASTTPAAKYSQAISPENRVGPADSVKTTVQAPAVSDMLEIEKTRLAQRIDQQISVKKSINTPQPARKLQLDVTITRYDKGNAFARAMLAGLGQIHLDGTARLVVLPSKKQIGEFTLNKTFAWGGIYGASVSMEDIENTYAEGIASAVTGAKEKKK